MPRAGRKTTPKNKLQRAHRVTGMAKLRRNLAKYGEQFGDALNKLAVDIGDRVHTTATGVLQTGEGRAPDPRTYELARSVVKLVQKSNKGKTFVRVGTGVRHGFYQEFGTTQNKAHPWLYPSLRKHRSAYVNGVKQLHEKALAGIDPDTEDA